MSLEEYFAEDKEHGSDYMDSDETDEDTTVCTLNHLAVNLNNNGRTNSKFPAMTFSNMFI